MGLDFSNIKDQEGAAIYCIHDGSSYQERRLQHFADELKKVSKKQVVMLSARDKSGAEVADFYDLQDFPAVLIVRDNDELYQHWTGLTLPMAQHVAHLVEGVG